MPSVRGGHPNGTEPKARPLFGGVRLRQPFALEFPDAGDHHDPIEKRDARQGEEAYGGRNGERHAAKPERKDAAHGCHGDVRTDDKG